MSPQSRKRGVTISCPFRWGGCWRLLGFQQQRERSHPLYGPLVTSGDDLPCRKALHRRKTLEAIQLAANRIPPSTTRQNCPQTDSPRLVGRQGSRLLEEDQSDQVG